VLQLRFRYDRLHSLGAWVRAQAAYLSSGRVKGLTHELYRYPARFSPELVRTSLAQFSNAEDYVLDPFVGGGTSAVEALVAGRRFAGFDLNPLSLVLTRAKTTPLYRRDKDVLRAWIERAFDGSSMPGLDDRLRNAPDSLVKVFAGPVSAVHDLPRARQRDAARALLLHVGQWALDGRQEPAPPEDVRAAALETLDRFLVGVDQLMGAARAIGVRPSALPTRRVLRCESASRAARGRGTARLHGRFRLVVTSPPYPGVHVLYHRWQVRGRSETAMPYWLADESDGLGPKHYTMGGRTQLGIDLYFRSMRETWRDVRRLLAPGAVVVQLIAFADPAAHLPRYLQLMEASGYIRRADWEPGVWRAVPNRKWYFRTRPERASAHEILLVHEAP
jgi:DNA methylase